MSLSIHLDVLKVYFTIHMPSHGMVVGTVLLAVMPDFHCAELSNGQ